MAEIRLRGGHVMLIDDADLPLLQGLSWHADKRAHTIYVRGRLPGTRNSGVYLHTLVAGEGTVDHVNGNGLDNRRANLRICTQGQNCLNARKRRKHKRFKGVYFAAKRGKWWAQLYIERRSIFGGYHNTEEQAARAYDALAIEYHGEFARLNFEAPA